MSNRDSLRKKALATRDKKAPHGADIALDEFISVPNRKELLTDLDQLSQEEQSLLSEVGIQKNEEDVAGTYVQIDQGIILYETLREGVEILPTSKALEQYRWLENYWWKAVSVATDKYTSTVELEPYEGYFIRSAPNSQTVEPIQSCLLLKSRKIKQNIHNIIIAEENSELHIITGCISPSFHEVALHLGVSEFYIKKNAKLTFTMIHKWNDRSLVRPRSAAIVEAGGTFVSNYVILSPVQSIQTYPTVFLQGEKAKVELNSVVYGSEQSMYDIGGRIVAEVRECSGKVISRTIGADSSTIYARGHLIGKASDTRAHLECNGLILDDTATIHAIPELSALVSGTELSHEATIGKVEAEQLYYLMSRGFTEEEANSLIVRGFIHLSSPELPERIQMSINDAIKLTKIKGL